MQHLPVTHKCTVLQKNLRARLRVRLVGRRVRIVGPGKRILTKRFDVKGRLLFDVDGRAVREDQDDTGTRSRRDDGIVLQDTNFLRRLRGIFLCNFLGNVVLNLDRRPDAFEPHVAAIALAERDRSQGRNQGRDKEPAE